MQADLEIVKKHFQKSIDKYNANAVVQKITAELLVQEIKNKNFENILEVGAGAGLLTEMISKNFNFNHYLSNDLIEQSEHYVKNYIPESEFIAGDFKTLNLNEKFNIIISNAVFQWFENLEEVINKCSNLLNRDGLLAFSTFAPDNFKELKEITGLSLKYKTTEELHSLLKKHFDIIKLENFHYEMKFNTPLEILIHMKNTGVNSLSQKNWTISDIHKFCEQYKKTFPQNIITYSPIIVIAKLK